MTLAWGWPLAWTALAALLVPLLLHLDRRRTLQPLRFAALRWLGAVRKPQRTLRIREWLLLLLRVGLLAAVVAWLAQPLLHGTWRAPREWLVVAPGIATAAIERTADQPAVWLVPGFPSLDAPPAVDGRVPFASLLRELDAQLQPDDRLRVIVPRELDGLDAAALSLVHPVDWQIDATATMPEPAAEPPLLAIRTDATDDASHRSWRDLVTAWNASPRFAVRVDEGAHDAAIPADASALVWFGSEGDGLREWIRHGGTVLQIGGDEDARIAPDGAPSNVAAPSGTHLRLAHFDPARAPVLRDPAFPENLHAALFGPPPAPTRADAASIAPRASKAIFDPPPTPLRDLLAIAVVLLFLVERVLASGRRLERSP